MFRPHIAQDTPIHGTTLLHIAAYFDEIEIAKWLLDHGMDSDTSTAVDETGFGGTPRSSRRSCPQQDFWVNYHKGCPDDASFTRILLDRGAAPNVRASLRHGFEEGHGGGSVREYHDVTPLGWGQGFPKKVSVSRQSCGQLKRAAAATDR